MPEPIVSAPGTAPGGRVAGRGAADGGPGPLAGLRVIEISSFVASPLGGMTLAQLGADVIRIDPIGGAPDTRRWPLAPSGTSLYWTGLNKGKRSLTVDLRSPAGQQLVQRLVTAPDREGCSGGILLTNAAGRDWMSYPSLRGLREDVIVVELLGRADGSPAVDYTVNAEVGLPLITGPPELDGPVNHVLPAWDIACGLYAALAILAAERARRTGGAGAHVRAALLDVALATVGNLGMLAEAELGTTRPRLGNHLFGGFAHDFATRDGRRVMVVTLTGRHWRDLVAMTGTGDAVTAVETALKADFGSEDDRYTHRDLLVALLRPWFAERDHAEVAEALGATSVLWSSYRGLTDLVGDRGAELAGNPMFSVLDQPGVGPHLAPASPLDFAGAPRPVAPAPTLGAHAGDVLRDIAGLSPTEIAALHEAGTLGPDPSTPPTPGMP